MDKEETIIKNAMTLPPTKKARLINQLISSLDEPDDKIDELWKREIEDRVIAYKEGKMKSIPLEHVLAKYRTDGSKIT
ncbi:addiction module protein [candidate division KSB1 bacterium]|nr:addiction module protein [candidate division KSB1 bacterium]